MVDMYLSPQIGVNSFSGIRENDVYRRRTDDGRLLDDSSSAVQWHKAELKMAWRYGGQVPVTKIWCKKNPFDAFKENNVYGRMMDGGTMDVHVMKEALLRSSTKRS